MTTPAELETKLWKSLKSDRTVMLGLAAEQEPHLQPMTALIEGDRGGPVWFFTSTETELAGMLRGPRRGLFTLASKGHDLFATVHGSLVQDMDRAVVDRLWNPFVAAWYEGGKDDPKLVLLRFDPDEARIWEDGSSLVAGVKALLHVDPKRDYKDHVASVHLQDREPPRAH